MATAMDDTGDLELLEMERKRCRGHLQSVPDLTRRQAFATRPYEQAKDIEPRVLGERRQGCDSFFIFHISKYIEI